MKKRMLSPIVKEVDADLETPVSAFLKLQGLGARFLLESAEKGERMGRFSFIGLESCEVLEIKKDRMIFGGQKILFNKDNFLAKLRSILFADEIVTDPLLSPFLGGWIGFLSYDLVRFFEDLPVRLPGSEESLLGILFLVKDILVFDHLKHKAKVISLVRPGEDPDISRKKIEKVVEALRGAIEDSAKIEGSGDHRFPVSNFTKDEFKQAVIKAKEYIFAGDIFQVVLSQKWTGETSASAFDVYRKLRMINPSPYIFYLDFNDFQMVGSSPEALVALKRKKATLHPIAGTKPRGKNSEEDELFNEELFKSKKEQAEHVMLVDLARNDLGKVCLPHTIKVSRNMELEKYSHVMHLVSEVEGELAPQYDALDLLKAVYPAGTVTGAPKIRAMEIIEELEKTRRDFYSGAVGYIGLDGSMDLCIAIRQIVCKGEQYFLQAGAGIVADSDPEMEYRETLHKMEGLYQALKTAVGRDNDPAYR